MADAIKCDRCRKFFLSHSDERRNSSRINENRSTEGVQSSHTYDLCESCTKEFIAWANSYPMNLTSLDNGIE